MIETPPIATQSQEEIPWSPEINYNNLSIKELDEELSKRTGGSIDSEVSHNNGSIIVLGEQIPEAECNDSDDFRKKVVIANILRRDFENSGIQNGDTIEFESIRGNVRRVKFLGSITFNGISIEIDGKPKAYFLDSIKRYRKI
ncbi:MAG: hypothetical protein WCW14_01230 [Candidatus Paceibacterota bacterium]|jgi:hypothetical protein